MREVIHGSEDPEARLRSWTETQGLVWQEQPLKSRSLARHVHFRKSGMKGTLEVTWEAGELIAEVRANRSGPWTEAAFHALVALFSPSSPQ